MSDRWFSQRMQRRTLVKATGLAAAAGGLSLAHVPHAFAQTPTDATGTVRLQMETGPGKDIAEVVDAFSAQFPEITIEFSQVDPAALGNQWARLAIESGSVDLVSNENPKFLFLDPVLKTGKVAPLDDYSTEYAWADVVVPEALKRSSRSGQLWTLPLYYELCGVAYRPSVLESVGLGVPQTWDEFVALLQAFKDQGTIPLTVGHRGFSQIMMLHNQLWASIGGPESISNLIFGDAKWTEGAPVEAANALVELYSNGLIDKDALSITQDDAAERFLSGEAAMHVTGTWFYSEMERNFDSDWDMFTAPGGSGAPVWCTGETEAMIIPVDAQAPDASAKFLNYCVQEDGAKILRELGNVLSSTAFGELAIPQVAHLPVVTGEPSAILNFGWFPQETQDAWQQGLGGILDGSVSVEDWLNDVQSQWEYNIENGDVPEDRASIL
jgi:raffinose/stachyose/melibiose transport system substrate-binding protein